MLTFTDNDVIIELLLTENDDYFGINGYFSVMNAMFLFTYGFLITPCNVWGLGITQLKLPSHLSGPNEFITPSIIRLLFAPLSIHQSRRVSQTMSSLVLSKGVRYLL